MVRLLRLDQWWGMFSPFPSMDDGWYVISGTTYDQKIVDVYHMVAKEPSFEKPWLVTLDYANGRWRKYLSNIKEPRHRVHLEHYAKHLCKIWNRTYPMNKIETLTIYFMLEKTNDISEDPAKKEQLYHARCKP